MKLQEESPLLHLLISRAFIFWVCSVVPDSGLMPKASGKNLQVGSNCNSGKGYQV